MSTWTATNKSTSSWTGSNKSSSSWTGLPISTGTTGALLQESGFYILQEDGVSKLLLEQSSGGGSVWTGLVKS